MRIYRSVWCVSTGLDFWPYMGLAQRGDLERCFSYGYSIACGNPDLLVGRLNSWL